MKQKGGLTTVADKLKGARKWTFEKHFVGLIFKATLFLQIWRRSYDVPPPPMLTLHPYFDAIRQDERYKEEPTPMEFPMYEALEDVLERTMPFWDESIEPLLQQGRTVLIVAHGTSLRAVVKCLDRISDDDISHLNLPTG